MDLQNIECQLAQAQMSRYLAGDALPEDTLQQLEKHVSGCKDCQAFADEKRVSLQEMLKVDSAAEPEAKKKSKKKKSDPEPEVLPASREVEDVLGDLMDAPTPELTDLYAAPAPTKYVPQPEPEMEELSGSFEPDASILDQLTEPEPAPIPDEPEAQPANPVVEPVSGEGDGETSVEEKVEVRTLSNKLSLKQHARTLALSAALGLVLIAMSVFMRNPTSLLGAKALPKKPSSTAKAEKEAPAKEPKHESEAKQPEKTEPPKVENHNPIGAPTKEDAPKKPEPPHEEKLVVAKADGEIEQRKYEHGKLVEIVPGEHKPAAKPFVKHAPVKKARTTQRRPRKQVRKPRPVASQSRQRSPHGSIRVYDSNGRPIASAR